MSQLSLIKDEQIRECLRGLLEKTNSYVKLDRDPQAKSIKREFQNAKI